MCHYNIYCWLRVRIPVLSQWSQGAAGSLCDTVKIKSIEGKNLTYNGMDLQHFRDQLIRSLLGIKQRVRWMLTTHQRRRIKTEEKANVVAASWGAELNEFFATLSIWYQDDLKNRVNCTRAFEECRMNSSFSSNHPGAK